MARTGRSPDYIYRRKELVEWTGEYPEMCGNCRRMSRQKRNWCNKNDFQTVWHGWCNKYKGGDNR